MVDAGRLLSYEETLWQGRSWLRVNYGTERQKEYLYLIGGILKLNFDLVLWAACCKTGRTDYQSLLGFLLYKLSGDRHEYTSAKTGVWVLDKMSRNEFPDTRIDSDLDKLESNEVQREARGLLDSYLSMGGGDKESAIDRYAEYGWVTWSQNIITVGFTGPGNGALIRQYEEWRTATPTCQMIIGAARLLHELVHQYAIQSGATMQGYLAHQFDHPNQCSKVFLVQNAFQWAMYQRYTGEVMFDDARVHDDMCCDFLWRKTQDESSLTYTRDLDDLFNLGYGAIFSSFYECAK